MTTTINFLGKTYVIPNDKIQHIVSLLEAYKVVDTSHEQVREVVSHVPQDGRSLING